MRFLTEFSEAAIMFSFYLVDLGTIFKWLRICHVVQQASHITRQFRSRQGVGQTQVHLVQLKSHTGRHLCIGELRFTKLPSLSGLHVMWKHCHQTRFHLTRKYLSCPYTVTMLIVNRDKLSLFSVAQYLMFLPNRPCKNAVWSDKKAAIEINLDMIFSTFVCLTFRFHQQKCLKLQAPKHSAEWSVPCQHLLARSRGTGRPSSMFVSSGDQPFCLELLQMKFRLSWMNSSPPPDNKGINQNHIQLALTYHG